MLDFHRSPKALLMTRLRLECERIFTRTNIGAHATVNYDISARQSASFGIPTTTMSAPGQGEPAPPPMVMSIAGSDPSGGAGIQVPCSDQSMSESLIAIHRQT